MSAMTPSLVILLGVTFLRCTHYSYAVTTVVGPSDTVYVNPGESASFNCSVTQWRTSSLPSIYLGRSRDDGSTWTNILLCYNEGTCNYAASEFQTVYSYETNAPEYNFFKFTVTSATLDEDAHYDCYSFEESYPASPPSPHGRLYVLNQVTDVSISGYNNGDTRTVDADTEVITTCTATSGNPPADLLWTIGDKDIKYVIDNTTTETGDDTRLYNTESRLLYSFNASDDQQYLKCQSFQQESITPRSAQILMNVKHAPVIYVIGVESWEGNTVTVECGASANPDDVTYSWESDDGQTGGNSRTWTLTDEDGDEVVTVTCNASNVKGETSLTEIVKLPFVDIPGLSTAGILGIMFGLLVAVLLGSISVFLWRFCRNKGDRKGTSYKTKRNHANQHISGDFEMTPTNIISAVSSGDVINADVPDDNGHHRLEGAIAAVREPRVDRNHESNADAMPVNSTMDIESLYASIEAQDLEHHIYLKSGEVVWEFPRGNIFLKETLSEGRFRKTVRGEAWYIGGKDGTSEVIIKIAIGDTDDFKREIQAMKVLPKHKGVVQMLGCCTDQDPIYLITEYASKGTLLSVLHDMKTKPNLHRKSRRQDHLNFAMDVANAMYHLSNIKIIHREIMAKTIVVDSQWKCKLSGLGSSSAVITDLRYRQKMKGHLPIGWMAPEVLSGNAYTTGSDVWSFGVLLWEIFTLGSEPYGKVPEESIKEFIQSGGTLKIPRQCPQSFHQLMILCWSASPDERPNFTDLSYALKNIKSGNKDYMLPTDVK